VAITCKIVVMADWQSLRTGNKLNSHRSMRTCSRARGSRMRRMDAHVCCVRRALRLLDSRRGCACKQIARPSAPASACVQGDGGVVFMGKGELVFDGVAISDTSATVRRPSAAQAGRGPSAASARRACAGPVAACSFTEAPFTWSMAPSRSEGAARSRARGRCARPGAIIRARALGVLVWF
jgi:hypothetical protein